MEGRMIFSDPEIENNLIQQVRQGNEEAFFAIYEQLHCKLYYYVLQYLKNRDDAEEVVQETFIRVWENRLRINPAQNLQGFIFRIARNLVLDEFRRKATFQKLKQRLEGLPNIDNNDYDLAQLEELLQAV